VWLLTENLEQEQAALSRIKKVSERLAETGAARTAA
jgi:hypothetical protein